MRSANEATIQPAKVWDLPVRAVHWSFVLLLPALWQSAERGNIALHKTLGTIMLGLVLFRVFWGLLGSSTARFTSFVKGPAAIYSYIRGRGKDREALAPQVGHNPLGAVSVIALLGLLLLQTSVGLFAQDVDGIESGPLAHLVSYDAADTAREVHHLVFNVLLGIVNLHILAILYYVLLKRERLVRPMLSGRKPLAAGQEAMVSAPSWRLAACILMSGGIAYWIAAGMPMLGSS